METENKEKTSGGVHLTETPYILKNGGVHALQVHVRQCRREELEEILRLQEYVYDTVTDKNTFVLSTREELAESLAADVCIGAYEHGRLIAFTLIVTDPDSPRNLGNYLNNSKARCHRCVTYDTTFVDPAYTGYGLQRTFLSLKNGIAVEMGACHALATVSPDNAVSLKNLRADGFEIADEKKMYGDRRRYIMRKTLIKRNDSR